MVAALLLVLAVGVAVTPASAAHASVLASVPVSNPGISFLSVSCSSAKDCTAVGQDGVQRPIYATEKSGVWGPAIEVSRSATAGELTGVSCTSALDCVAVGFDGQPADGSAPFPIHVTETDGVWGALSEGTEVGGLLAVSCSAATHCTAVGFDSTSPTYVSDTSGKWGAADEIGGEFVGGFNGVSCTSPLDCTAVGEGNNEPIYATETAGTWGAAKPISESEVALLSVSCRSATDCTAVGDTGNGDPIYATETSGVWGAATGVAAPGKSQLTSVSCSSATNCTAVGETQATGGKQQPMHATETAGRWGAATELASPLGGGFLFGVSCTSPKDCTAVGSDAGYALYPTESDGVWPTVPRAPRIGAVTAGNKLVKVTWTAPTSDGGAAVTGYTALATNGNRTFTCATSRRNCTIHGLTNGLPYAISVIDRTPAGSSAPSVTKTATPHA